MVNHFDFHTFTNGLRLITVPMEHTKTITVLVMVGTGSRYETKEINGISHFLEHMMFKGTDKRPKALDISLELDAIGAEYNAFTSKEYTGYYAKAAMEHFDFVLEIISDIFLNSKLDPAEVEKERGVVVQEINMNFDNPMRHIMDVHEGLLYGDQPLGWTIAGPKENILKMPVEKFREYFDSHYFAQNTVVAVAGNVSSEKVRQEVTKYFDGMRQREMLKPVPVIIDQKEPALKIFNKQTDQTHVFLGVRGYDMFDPRREILKIMSVILGGGMSSRLFTEVREKRGLAYYVGADADFYMDTGDFSSFAGLEGEKLKPAIEVILGEFRKLKEEKVSEKELKKAKDSIKGRMAISFESSDDLASFYASQELLQKEMLTPEEKFEKLNKVSVDDIFEAANDIFRTDKLNLAVIGPFKEKDPKIYNLLKL
ncbi:MAG: insulinase family protein [Candidatus Yanofskybacteria bacterium]|nr:insulinase family protein [Candidatus Yanofskybacteria bacterium]